MKADHDDYSLTSGWGPKLGLAGEATPRTPQILPHIVPEHHDDLGDYDDHGAKNPFSNLLPGNSRSS